mgnify:CR=1 FL=1
MGINPNSGDGVEKNYTIDGRQNAENLVTEAEHTGQEAGKVFAHIAAQSDSANTGMSELSKRVSALEKQSTPPDLTGYPLFLWWDGTGTKPPLKPGWALININTGKVEKG